MCTPAEMEEEGRREEGTMGRGGRGQTQEDRE